MGCMDSELAKQEVTRQEDRLREKGTKLLAEGRPLSLVCDKFKDQGRLDRELLGEFVGIHARLTSVGWFDRAERIRKQMEQSELQKCPCDSCNHGRHERRYFVREDGQVNQYWEDNDCLTCAGMGKLDSP